MGWLYVSKMEYSMLKLFVVRVEACCVKRV